MRRVLDAAARRPRRVDVGSDAWSGPGTHEAMLLAAGGLLAAVEAVLDGDLDAAFALLRPPGHHAERDARDGLLPVNNVAIAARWAQRERGVERVAILDWDVHHGNGTEEIFLDDPSVLTISLHQDGLYPADTRRARDARGGAVANVNVPLPAGTGDDGYLHAVDARRRAGAARLRARPAADRRRAGRVRHRSARADGDHRAGLPRADRPRRGARRRAVRRAARGDARGRLLAAAPAAGQPRDPRGARRACRRRSRATRSAPTCRGRCATSSGRAVAAAERAHRAHEARRARPLDRGGGRPAPAPAARRATHAPTSSSSAAATPGCGRPGTCSRPSRTRASCCSRRAAAATGRAGATAGSCPAST